MAFSSLTFLFSFFPVVLSVYYLCPGKAKNWVLAASSLVFYAWGKPLYVLPLLFTSLSDYTAGRVIHRYFHRPGIRRAALTASIAGNLLLLGTFRYSGFIVRSLNAAFGWALPAPAFSPPAAICFYTLQSISYILDLSRGDAEVQKNYLSYLAGISMFPRLTAGPVVRWGKMSQELECRRISLPQIGEGAFQLVIGLGKKVLIADNIGLLWQQVEAASGDLLPAVTAWLGILAFTFQIYFAFSGYSDMACGIGRMLGFSFPQNFNFPYMAQSVTDFWQRWHMTLTRWFDDYLYLPLGGNQKSPLCTVRNLLIVWLLIGLWHGPGWNYVLWGLYFAVVLIGEKFLLGRLLLRIPYWLRRIYAFLMVLLGWVFFEMETPAAIGRFFRSLLGLGGFADAWSGYLLMMFGLLLLVCVIASNNWLPVLFGRAEKRWPVVKGLRLLWMLLVFAASLAFLVNSPSSLDVFSSF